MSLLKASISGVSKNTAFCIYMWGVLVGAFIAVIAYKSPPENLLPFLIIVALLGVLGVAMVCRFFHREVLS